MEGFHRESFDLQLQRYYSSQRNGSPNASNLEGNDPQKFASLIEDHCVDTLALREANYTARRRITELESELVELRAKKDIESPSFTLAKHANNTAVILSKGSGTSSVDTHIEENRRRERQATLAIAEHDGILIRRLEAEVIHLSSQHEMDMRVIDEAADKCADLMHENGILHSKYLEKEALSRTLEIQVKMLTDHLQNSKIILENERRANRNSILALGTPPTSATIDTVANIMTMKDQRDALEIASSKKYLPLNENKYQNDEFEKTFSGRTRTLLPQKNEKNSRSNSSSTSRSSISKSSTVPIRYGNNGIISNDYNNSEYYDGNYDGYYKNGNHQNNGNGHQNNRENIYENENKGRQPMNIEQHLRIENDKLIADLVKERAVIRRQETALNQVRTSAEEITLLEAEEICRLENELEKCTDSKEEWERRCNSALLQIKNLQINNQSNSQPHSPVHIE